MNAGARRLSALPDAAHWPEPPAGEFAIPMQGAAWMRARAELVAPPARQLLAVDDAQGAAALAPLMDDGAGLCELPALFEPSDLAWRTPQALAALARALARQPRPLRLDRLPADSPTLAALRQAYAGRGWLRLQPAMPTPVILLDPRGQRDTGNSDDHGAGFDARRRADFRRYERRAAARGALHYELVAPAPGAALQRLLTEAYGVEARSWKAAAGSALSSSPWQGRFFRLFAAEAAAAGQLRIALLRIDGQAVAMQIALQWRQRFWLLKISHDQDFAACSPGQLLMRHTLRHAVREGLLSYELMGVMADWTRLWTRDTRRYVQLQAWPFSAATLRAGGERLARAAWRRLRGRPA